MDFKINIGKSKTKAEDDVKKELNEIHKTFGINEKNTLDYTANAEFYCNLVFPNMEIRNLFLQKIGIDAADPMYIDGMKLAEKIGIELPKDWKKINAKINPKYKDLAL